MVANDTRCVAYKRISGAPGQLLGYSFDEDQPREIEALAAGHKLQIVRWFDDVQSGGTAVRAGLMAMLEYCAAEQIRYVVAYKFDRISRIESLSERGMLLGALIANEIAVVTTDKVFDPASNPADILGYEVVSAVGAAYLRDLRQRIRLSWIGRFERCLYAPGKMTFGYKRNATKDDASRPLTVYLQEPEQAEVVKEIYARYIGGEPSTQIAADLTNRRVAKHGGPVWLDTLVTRIIQNPAYAGFIFPRGNPLEMRRAANLPDPIVSYETWCEANRVRQERRRLAPRQKTAGAVFSGLLVCAECGSPMQCKGSHAKISWHRDFVEVDEDGTSRVVRRAWSAAKYYQCTLAVSSAYRQCGQHSVREDTLLESIYEMVQPIILDRLSAEAVQAARRRDTELAAHADAISKQRLVLIENVAKGLITQADFETVIRPMNEELAAIQDRMRSSATGFAVVGGRAVSSLFWLENHQQLMVVLRKCVSRIHCRDRHPVVIEADVNYISRQTIAGRVVQVEPSSQGTTLPLHLDANGEVMSVNLDRIVEAARALRVEVEASAVEPDTAATA